MVVSQEDLELFQDAIANTDFFPKESYRSLEELLLKYKLSQESAQSHVPFVKAAVRILSCANPHLDQYIKFLLTVKPRISARYLVASISNPDHWGTSPQVLLAYGPSKATVKPLVGSLGNPRIVSLSSGILIAYGEKALQFIRPPEIGTPIYSPLTAVIYAIK